VRGLSAGVAGGQFPPDPPLVGGFQDMWLVRPKVDQITKDHMKDGATKVIRSFDEGKLWLCMSW
jgi:hypothetical protein